MQQPLADWVADDASAAQIAAAVFAIWEEVDDALSPVLGAQGVVALYRRSVHIASKQYPWLAGRDEAVLTDTGPAVLKAVLEARSSAEAADAGSSFLSAFRAVLESLIGPSLSARLLRKAWDHSASGTAAQDNVS